MWMMAGAIGISALQSYTGGSAARYQAKTQNYLQKAQAYQQNAREYAQLTSSVKAQGRQNDAIVQAEAYNYANLMDNVGAMDLRDAQLKQMANRNKVLLRNDGLSSKGTVAAQAGAVGAVGVSVNAMMRDVDSKVDKALTDMSQQRANQIYDNSRQQQVMWRNFYQNQQEIDDSVIDEAFLPQAPIDIGSASGGLSGGFLPHLIGAGLNFGMQHMADSFAVGLQNKNPSGGIPPLNLISEPMYNSPVFKDYTNVSKAYAYRR